MKKLFTTIIFCIAVLSTPFLQAQQFQWVTGGGTAEDFTTAPYYEQEGTYYECTDNSGNIYALSEVGDYAIYADTFYKSADGAVGGGILITSYTCSGQMRWAKLVSSSSDVCFPLGIVADTMGHIYVAGNMRAATLYIGYDTAITTGGDLFIGLIQFDTSGHFNWERYVGTNIAANEVTATEGAALTIDSASNIHFTPYIGSGAVLMPSVTSHYGIYDLKYNAAGTLLSAKRLQLDSTIGISGAIIDKQNNTLFAYGYRTFPDSSYYCFIAAFDTADNLKWVDTLADPDGIGGQYFGGIAPDGAGHLYVCGGGYEYLIYRGDTIATPPGSYPGYIAFIMKTDTSGHMEWVKQSNGENVNYFGLTLMPGNKIAAVGYYQGLANSGADTINSDTKQDPYFTIIDTAGGLIALQDIHGDGVYNWGNSIASDKTGNLYIGGQVEDSIAVDCCNSITPYVSVGGNTDFFVLKYGVPCSCTTTPIASFTSVGTTTVNFTYSGTTTDLDSLVWSFGDGNTDTGSAPAHSYSASGTYTVCVTAYTGCGSSTSCSDIVVNCTPVASFTDTGNVIKGFAYSGTTAGLDSVVWNFGDGHTAMGTTALHTYSANGTYTVCATVYTSCGIDSACNTVTVTTVGVPLLSVANIKVFPNPVGDELNVTGVMRHTDYRLLNVTGICVQRGILKPGGNSLSMQKCVPGVYVLEMTDENGERNMVRVVKE